jgi:putative permease
MFKVLRDWIQRYFSDEEAVVLAVLLFLAFTAVLTLGGMLAPVLAGMVLAYLMQGLVVTLERMRVPGGAAVGLVFALFMGLLLVFIVVVVPLLWHQLITLFNELPGMLAKWQSLLLLLPERYPHLVSDEQVLQAIEVARRDRQVRPMGADVLAVEFAAAGEHHDLSGVGADPGVFLPQGSANDRGMGARIFAP